MAILRNSTLILTIVRLDNIFENIVAFYFAIKDMQY